MNTNKAIEMLRKIINFDNEDIAEIIITPRPVLASNYDVESFDIKTPDFHFIIKYVSPAPAAADSTLERISRKL